MKICLLIAIRIFLNLILLNTILVSDGIPQVHETDSSQVGLKKNIIYGTVGYAGLYGVANANYERLIIQKNTGFTNCRVKPVEIKNRILERGL